MLTPAFGVTRPFNVSPTSLAQTPAPRRLLRTPFKVSQEVKRALTILFSKIKEARCYLLVAKTTTTKSWFPVASLWGALPPLNSRAGTCGRCKGGPWRKSRKREASNPARPWATSATPSKRATSTRGAGSASRATWRHWSERPRLEPPPPPQQLPQRRRRRLERRRSLPAQQQKLYQRGWEWQQKERSAQPSLLLLRPLK
mmetsp:Transcript_80339/g.160364  ORF Transcript_80339/g.160364 Transcript_80339/m.160364 type:complete len:200 (-) Transcript_80339:312-911(-)